MYTIGIDIGGTSVKMGVVGRDVEPVWRMQIPTLVGDPEAFMGQIAEAVREAMKRYEIGRVGVACAGAVALDTGRVWADNLEFSATPVRDMLEEELGLPVWVDNDAQAALLAEWTSGACKGVDHAVFLSFGTGIGGALICNGQPYRGRNNGGAELGHIITHAGGEKCPCGLNGCYEAYASARALERMAGKPARQAIDLARAGDRQMREVFERYCYEMCIGIASLLNVFEPQVLVIGGGISGAGRYLLDNVHRILREMGAWAYSDDVIITLARHRNDAGLLGAAALAEYYIEQ